MQQCAQQVNLGSDGGAQLRWKLQTLRVDDHGVGHGRQAAQHREYLTQPVERTTFVSIHRTHKQNRWCNLIQRADMQV